MELFCAKFNIRFNAHKSIVLQVTQMAQDELEEDSG